MGRTRAFEKFKGLFQRERSKGNPFKVPEGHRPFRIYILVPTRGQCHTFWAYDFAHLCSYNQATLVRDGVAMIQPVIQSGTYVYQNRNDLAETALKEGADYLFWLDDDMRFPESALLHLLNRREAFVGANYCSRMVPAQFVAIKKTPETGDRRAGSLCYTAEGQTGVESVDALGFGVTLVKREVFEKVEYPWFNPSWDKDKKRWTGEDVDFCRRARAAGFDPKVDHDLSHQVTHLGQLEYTLELARGVAAEDPSMRATITDYEERLKMGRTKPTLVDAKGEPIGT